MLKIEYEIKIDDKDGILRPYIELPPDYDNKPEDRFFAIELAQYMLIDSLNRNKNRIDDNSVLAMESTLDNMSIVSFEIGKIILEGMTRNGEAQTMLMGYSFEVETIEDLELIENKNIVVDGKFFKSKEDLKVRVKSESKIYVYDSDTWIQIL